MASERTRRKLTPVMAHILAVAYPELDRHLRASQKPQGGEYSGHYYNNWWLYSPSSSTLRLVFQVEHGIDEHGEDVQFWFHGDVVLLCDSDGESLVFCDVFPQRLLMALVRPWKSWRYPVS
ncbi:hypothetical protein NDU88_007154 [Pleurodeles waltl]|uniref:Uncharacterized protein n=1 Tax=Pleurodeles waltl TaxID=8319 RepID=A0AAV7N2N1_PLEWA|nr:hypothetical protein NDU88_007154 [Pleurodeles waltl]